MSFLIKLHKNIRKKIEDETYSTAKVSFMGNKTFHSTKERDLIAAAIGGDHSCLSELYTRYFPKVVCRCLSFVKDKATADDLAQDVLLRAIEKLPSFQQQASFSTWLYAIATNYCLEHLRKERQHMTVSLEEGVHVSIDEREGESQLLRLDLLENNLSVFLKQLNGENRKLLISKYGYDKSIEELQKDFCLSSSAIKMRLKRSKQRLAQLFDKAQGL